jgi:hypothetical protein
MGSGADKRQHMTAMRAARMRREGFTLTEIANATGIARDRVAKRIELGERLISLDAAAALPPESVSQPDEAPRNGPKP